MESKTIEKLEFNKVLEKVSSYAITYSGKEMVLSIKPLESKEEIEKQVGLVSEASILLYRKGTAPISEIADIKEHLKKLNSSLFLTAGQLLDLVKLLIISRSLREYFFSTEIDMSEFPLLTNLFNNLYVNESIEKAISTAIIDENTIDDNASRELAGIRRAIKSKETEIRNKLNQLVHSKYVQEPVITKRQGRFVIPVKSEYKAEVKGFVHDLSQSGSTFFIEPISVFELNNDLNNLRKEEQNEIERILQKLSSLFFDIIPNIENDFNLITIIDFIYAKAKYSNDNSMNEPMINTKKEINLSKAWHPLIDKNKVVKNDITIGDKYTSLIITGPNTGGKTVTLKTAGLIVLMAISGLHIPAGELSSIFIPDNIFADIGDDQSILDSLSTFSSHMTNISHILKNATSSSFVLIDELGSGTDPVEGSALAISILEKLKSKGSIVLSTTHYPEIKHFALVTDGFENASVEFDLETLSPTYKLLLGVPGTSNAFAISKKLGISEEIISRAKEYTDTSKVSVEELLSGIYEDKKKAEDERAKAMALLAEAEELNKKASSEYKDLKEKEKSIIEDAKAKARDILVDAKDEVTDIIREVTEAKDLRDVNNQRNRLNQKIAETGINNSDYEEPSDDEKPLTLDELKHGMEVYIKKIDQFGTVASIDKSGKALIMLPLGRMYFAVSDMYEKKSDAPKQETRKDYSKNKEFKAKSISPEINLLGCTVDEACLTLDKYLDECYLAGLGEVRIVHGKGTGALRQGVQAFLKTNPHVKSYRIGAIGEGDTGVTIVTLK